MDYKNRTCSVAFEMSDEVLRLLRRAADHALELACDFGDWNEDVRAGVLNAARMVDVFHKGRPSALQVAELATTRCAAPSRASIAQRRWRRSTSMAFYAASEYRMRGIGGKRWDPDVVPRILRWLIGDPSAGFRDDETAVDLPARRTSRD